MRVVAVVLSIVCGGCSITTSLDGIFDGKVDSSVGPGVEDSDGLIFPTDDTAPPPCGAKTEPCCEGKCNAGLVCTTNKCGDAPACGASGQPCCGGSACNSGLDCQMSKCVAGTATKCGASGEACCAGGACVG